MCAFSFLFVNLSHRLLLNIASLDRYLMLQADNDVNIIKVVTTYGPRALKIEIYVTVKRRSFPFAIQVYTQGED